MILNKPANKYTYTHLHLLRVVLWHRYLQFLSVSTGELISILR